MSKQPQENITTVDDYVELRKAYKFITNDEEDNKGRSNTSGKNDNMAKASSTWQERMVQHYDSHLYKSHVVADMTLFKSSKLGLRWRTKKEVVEGKGFDTCGNKHCPCYYDNYILVEEDNMQQSQGRKKTVEEVIRWQKTVENRTLLESYNRNWKSMLARTIDVTNSMSIQSILQSTIGVGSDDISIDGNSQPKNDKKEQALMDVEEEEKKERANLQKVPHGLGLHDYQVHFAYTEQGVNKEELVKLRLCLRCAPMLFHRKGGALTAFNARQATNVSNAKAQEIGEEEDVSSNEENDSSSSSASPSHKRQRKRHRSSRERRKGRSKKKKKRKSKRKRSLSEGKKRKHKRKNVSKSKDPLSSDSSSFGPNNETDNSDEERRLRRRRKWQDTKASIIATRDLDVEPTTTKEKKSLGQHQVNEDDDSIQWAPSK